MALGDRRAHVRLEVVGSLWATLELAQPARVLNISHDGALISSPVAMVPESVQPLHLSVGGRDVAVKARVRHVRQVPGNADRHHYLVGVEFLSHPPELRTIPGWQPS